jgi:hypothetical protein
MIDTYATAITHYVEAGGTRYGYRPMGKESGVPLIFMQNFRQGMDNIDPWLLDELYGINIRPRNKSTLCNQSFFSFNNFRKTLQPSEFVSKPAVLNSLTSPSSQRT